MKLTKALASRMMSSLRVVDQAEAVRLSGQIRLDIARNITRLLPEVSAFDRAVAARRRDIKPGEAAMEANNAILAEIDAMGDAEIEVKLYKFKHDDLKLDDNPRITGDMISALAPILKDFDTMNDTAE